MALLGAVTIGNAGMEGRVAATGDEVRAATATRAVRYVPAYQLEVLTDDSASFPLEALDGDTTTVVGGTDPDSMLLFVLMPYQARVAKLELFLSGSAGGARPTVSLWGGASASELQEISTGKRAKLDRWTKIRVPRSARQAVVFAVHLESRGGAELAEIKVKARAAEDPTPFDTYDAMLSELVAIGGSPQSVAKWDTSLGRRMARVLAHWEAHPEQMEDLLTDLCRRLKGMCGRIKSGGRSAAVGPGARSAERAGAKAAWVTFHGWMLNKARKLVAPARDLSATPKSFEKTVRKNRFVAMGIRDGAVNAMGFGLGNVNRSSGIDPSCNFKKISVSSNPECWGSPRAIQRVEHIAYRTFLKGLEFIGADQLLQDLQRPNVVADNNTVTKGTVTVVAQRPGPYPPFLYQSVGINHGQQCVYFPHDSGDGVDPLPCPRLARVPVSLDSPTVRLSFGGPTFKNCNVAPFSVINVSTAWHTEKERFVNKARC